MPFLMYTNAISTSTKQRYFGMIPIVIYLLNNIIIICENATTTYVSLPTAERIFVPTFM